MLSTKKEYNEKLVDKNSFLFTKYWGTNLNLEIYLDIVEKSNSYYEYLLILFENNYTNFSLRELNLFCLKYMFNDYIVLEAVVDIKEISYKSPYTNIKEPKRFQNIESFWKEKDYGKVFWEENNILVNLMKEYWKENWEEPFKNKKVDIPKVLKKILANHKIPQLTDAIDKIINLFSDARNMLGKEEGKTMKNKEWIESFENSLEINRKINTRITIDLMKSIHNLIVISNIERNRN